MSCAVYTLRRFGGWLAGDNPRHEARLRRLAWLLLVWRQLDACNPKPMREGS